MARKLKEQGLKVDGEEIERILHYQNLLYILTIILTKLISYYYNDLLARYFEIKKTYKLITQKYH